MRICLIADGSSEHIFRLSKFLIDNGHEVHLICWKKRNVLPGKIHVHLLNKLRVPVIRELAWIIQTRRLVRKIKPDIVDGHFITVYGFVAAFADFHPLVVTAWGSDLLIHPWRSLVWKFTATYAIRNADKVVCLFPKDNAGEALSKLGVIISKVDNYVLGVDTDIFKRALDNEHLRLSLGIRKTDIMVLDNRGLAPVYDIDTLIKAIPIVMNSAPHTKFIIVHKPGDQTMVSELRKRPDVADNVIFMGQIPHSEMPGLLSASDIYISPALSDGASNALFEAMSCQVAPVVTDIPANRVWIKDGENGFLFQTKDYQALAEKILILIKDQELRVIFSKKCREVALNNLEQNSQLAKILKIYQNLISDNVKKINTR